MAKTNTSKNKKPATAVRRKPESEWDRLLKEFNALSSASKSECIYAMLMRLEAMRAQDITFLGRVIDDGRKRDAGLRDAMAAIQADLSLLKSGASFVQEIDAKVIDQGLDHTIMEINDGAATGSWVCLRPDDPRLKPPPQEEQGLENGDYTDSSKELADALTAMGWGWYDEDRVRLKWIVRADNDASCDQMINTSVRRGSRASHLTTADFLSRARVTAKKLGLVPVDPAKIRAKEEDQKLARLTFGTRVKHNTGTMIYWYTLLSGKHKVVGEGGACMYVTTSDITIID